MFKSFTNFHCLTLLVLVSLSTHSLLNAQEYIQGESGCCDVSQECCEGRGNRFYIGGFGGELFSDSTCLIQRGTAFFTEAQGGPLAVDARGHARKESTGFGGVQIGYEWSQCPLNMGCSNWGLTPAVELEAYFYQHKRKGHLINPTNRLDEHDFKDSFRLDTQVYFINGVLSLNNPCFGRFSPYVGGGIGAARLHISRAKSLQVEPPERGINHFNSDRSDSAWAFAAQAKAGLRYHICDRFHIFGEYRFLYIDSSRFLLGSTVYPNHAATSPWDFDIKNTNYNGFAFGLQYDLY